MNKWHKQAMGWGMLLVIILGIIFILLAQPLIKKIYTATNRIDIPDNYDDLAKNDEEKEAQLIELNSAGGSDFAKGDYSKAADKYEKIIEDDKTDKIVSTILFEIGKSFYEKAKLVESNIKDSGSEGNGKAYYEKSAVYLARYIAEKPNDNQERINTAYEDIVDAYIKIGSKDKADALAKTYRDKYGENDTYSTLKALLGWK